MYTATKEDREKLKKYGFQWYKNHTTDRVEENGIEDVIPSVGGFTVVYKNLKEIVFLFSTATVEKIEYPETLETLETQWIRVHWIDIKDERKP